MGRGHVIEIIFSVTFRNLDFIQREHVKVFLKREIGKVRFKDTSTQKERFLKVAAKQFFFCPLRGFSIARILDGDVRATSRTFNTTPDGTFGQYIGGTDQYDVYATGNDATLIQLTSSPSNDSGFRTNLGLVNLEGFPITIDIDLYLADLYYLGRVSTSLEPYDFKQIDNIFSRVTNEDVPDGIAIIRARPSNSSYLVYASVIDNLTNDPTTVPMR